MHKIKCSFHSFCREAREGKNWQRYHRKSMYWRRNNMCILSCEKNGADNKKNRLTANILSHRSSHFLSLLWEGVSLNMTIHTLPYRFNHGRKPITSYLLSFSFICALLSRKRDGWSVRWVLLRNRLLREKWISVGMGNSLRGSSQPSEADKRGFNTPYLFLLNQIDVVALPC